MQQNAKICYFLRPYDQPSIRVGLELIEKVFDRDPIVRAFDRNQLVGGDILQDFCSEVLGLRHLVPTIPFVSENTTLSAEATRALLDYGQFLDDLEGEISEEQSALVIRRISLFVDPAGSLTALTLNPDLVDAIRRSADQYIWLRDKFGIEFEELDYDNIKSEAVGALERFNNPDEIFEYDHHKQAWLLLSILHTMTGPGQGHMRDKEHQGSPPSRTETRQH